MSWFGNGVTIFAFGLDGHGAISHAGDDPSGRTMKPWLLKVAFRIGMPLALWPLKLLDTPRSHVQR
ncbi:hypothetical protein SynPROS71_01084 [Synechococcus sp. PROS-7-1]|nr:hypothetical protein SynPROS71_01084 [Synechococcus sp. PROS-7-1]